ncbi:MAG: NUDIX domain-containing protein [Patescibacteria group bacterium]
MDSFERYRPNVAVLLTDGHGRVLLCERIEERYSGIFQTVQGGIDEGESVVDAALRETSEELGIDPSVITILGVMEKKFRYRWTEEYLASIAYRSSPFIGQEHHFVFAQIEPGTPMVLDAHQREFRRVLWGTPQELIEKSWEGKRPGFIAALEYFGLLNVKFLA